MWSFGTEEAHAQSPWNWMAFDFVYVHVLEQNKKKFLQLISEYIFKIFRGDHPSFLLWVGYSCFMCLLQLFFADVIIGQTPLPLECWHHVWNPPNEQAHIIFIIQYINIYLKCSSLSSA